MNEDGPTEQWGVKNGGMMRLTALEALEALLDGLLVLLALLDLLELHLLAELLALTLLALLLGALHARALVKQALANALHVRVALDHLCEVVCGSREGEVVLLRERARGLRTMKGLLVAEVQHCQQTDRGHRRGRHTRQAHG